MVVVQISAERTQMTNEEFEEYQKHHWMRVPAFYKAIKEVPTSDGGLRFEYPTVEEERAYKVRHPDEFEEAAD